MKKDDAMPPHNKALAGDTGGLLDGYLTEQQLADELDVTIRTLRNWRAVGETPRPTRIGKRLFFARDDCQAWLQRQRIESEHP